MKNPLIKGLKTKGLNRLKMILPSLILPMQISLISTKELKNAKKPSNLILTSYLTSKNKVGKR